MSHNGQAPCPICGEPDGFHGQHPGIYPPTDWRVVTSQPLPGKPGWLRHTYDDESGRLHVVDKNHSLK